MSVAGNVLRFTYDAIGTPLTVIYEDITYYYVVNLQGDIVAILDSTGTEIVTYTYDAWGNILSTSGSLAQTLGSLNPLRYRGYVYDTETGLYYLQSRYYNPQWGRFISADNYISTGQGVLGYNMFAYCLNNPVNGIDPCGTCLHRWDFWKACERCAAKTAGDYFKEAVDVSVYAAISSTPYGAATNILRLVHYGRNLLNKSYTKGELEAMDIEALPQEEDKFHQNNQRDGRNEKYVIGNWFSSEVVLYADGTVNNTPEDEGTVNVYYGDNIFGKYVIHGVFDVAPYMLWGNSFDDSTTIIDRIIIGLR